MPGAMLLRMGRFAAAVWAATALSCTFQQAPDLTPYLGPGARATSLPGNVGAASAAAPTTAPATSPATVPAGTPASAPATAPATTLPDFGELSRAAASGPSGPPVRLTVQEAILRSLENNRSLAVQRLSPAITATGEQVERSAFDPIISGEVSGSRVRSERLSRSGSTTEGSVADSAAASLSADVHLPTGTDVQAVGTTSLLDSSLYDDRFQTTRVGLSVTQALLQGASPRANLASLRQARLDTLASQYELRGFAEALVADVETAYWDYALAQREIDIQTGSLNLAEQQLAETQERIRIGVLAETEQAAAQAEVALRREGLIIARSALAQRRLGLLRLLNWPSEGLFDRPVELANEPIAPEVRLADVAEHVRVALRMRPDLNQARLLVQRDELEIVKTKDGLLPRLDFFITLGRSGYAENFRRSAGNLGGDGYDALIGLRGEYPPLNREARAVNRRAVLSREQSAEAVRNLQQLIELDVRSAYIDVEKFREEIAATATTRKFQAEKLRAETEKLRVGKSTSLLVAAAQRDLLASQIAEVRAVVAYVEALVILHRLEGSLLERRGIAAPGRQPVESR